jgi:predicted MFS family arabinose efflux permease
MAVGMFLSARAADVIWLSVYRFATGLGIGGMLAAASAMAAEFANNRRRNISVIMMAAGYPVGVIVGGSIASWLLVYFDWRIVFNLGAFATLCFIPLVWYLIPESIEHLLQRRPNGALDRINNTLKRMGHATIAALPEVPAQVQKPGLVALFSPALARTTILLTIAYFAHIMTFYFTLKWIPKIVSDMGFAASAAGGVLVWASVGGLCGCIFLGILTLRFQVRGLVILMLLLGAGMVIWFGQGQANLFELSLVAAAAGFFTNAGVVGLYAIFARSFPTQVRASGTGFAIGFGRGGSAMGPIIAGYLFAAGVSLPSVALVMAMGSVLGALLLLFLKDKEPRPRF